MRLTIETCNLQAIERLVIVEALNTAGTILADVQRLPFVPLKGYLGFFSVQDWQVTGEYAEAWRRLGAIEALDLASAGAASRGDMRAVRDLQRELAELREVPRG